MPWLKEKNLVPLTVDEFHLAQRRYPIVFSSADVPVPLALMALEPEQNAFVGGDGEAKAGIYIPAYARRYPFLLAKLNPDSSELSLCFDRASGLVGPFEDGMPLFDKNTPSSECQRILQFCQGFEDAGSRTRTFVAALLEYELLVEAETKVDVAGDANSRVYNGFKIVDAAKLPNIQGQILQEWLKNGVLSSIFAHLSSLGIMSELAERDGTQKS